MSAYVRRATVNAMIAATITAKTIHEAGCAKLSVQPMAATRFGTQRR